MGKENIPKTAFSPATRAGSAPKELGLPKSIIERKGLQEAILGLKPDVRTEAIRLAEDLITKGVSTKKIIAEFTERFADRIPEENGYTKSSTRYNELTHYNKRGVTGPGVLNYAIRTGESPRALAMSYVQQYTAAGGIPNSGDVELGVVDEAMAPNMARIIKEVRTG